MNQNEKITYVNERGQSVEFSVYSPFFCTDISGIDGLTNNIYTSKSMGQDGTTITGDNLSIRDITIQGAITEDKENNRLKLLSILNPKLDGKLIYNYNGVEKLIECKVEKAPTITKEFLPKFSVQFYCANPYWQYIEESKAEIASWTGDFSFEFEILESGIELGHRNLNLIVNVINEGDVPCGITVKFKALATIVNPKLLNVTTGEYIKFNKTMTEGEVITVTTGFGNKKVESDSNGVTSNAFNYIDLNSSFLQLDVGDNLFKYEAEQNIDNLECYIYYTPQYLGV